MQPAALHRDQEKAAEVVTRITTIAECEVVLSAR
jgi:hypothetical protein